MREAILALLLTGCGPFCGETAIGALVTFSETKEMCSEYDRRFVEAKSFIELAANPNIPSIDWSSWSLSDGSSVAGQTDCFQYRSIFVGHAGQSESALAHEMVHAMQGCSSGPGDADGYKYWTEQGIWKMLDSYPH